MRNWFHILVLMVGASSSFARSNPEIECLGNPKSTKQIVYLHGVDSSSPSQQELNNREVLKRLSQDLGIRIAMPRATKVCQQGLICWTWSYRAMDFVTTAKIVENAAKSCFPPDARFGFLGFSNGGYVLTALYEQCRFKSTFPKADWIVTLGSAKWTGQKSSGSLAECGSLSMLIGNADKANSDVDASHITSLVEREANAEEILFQGDHELSYEPLKDALKVNFLERRYENFSEFKEVFLRCVDQRDRICIKTLIAKDVQISFGFEPLPDRRNSLVDSWSDKDLAELASLIRRGTGKGESPISFPPHAGMGQRGIFEKVGGAWKLTAYLAGD